MNNEAFSELLCIAAPLLKDYSWYSSVLLLSARCCVQIFDLLSSVIVWRKWSQVCLRDEAPFLSVYYGKVTYLLWSCSTHLVFMILYCCNGLFYWKLVHFSVIITPLKLNEAALYSDIFGSLCNSTFWQHIICFNMHTLSDQYLDMFFKQIVLSQF